MLPEKLVIAAAEALARSESKTLEQAPYMRDYARDALAAAFAALPECDEVVISVGGDLPHNRATVRNVLRSVSEFFDADS